MAAPNWNYEVKQTTLMYLISFYLISVLAQKFKIFIRSIYFADRGGRTTPPPSDIRGSDKPE